MAEEQVRDDLLLGVLTAVEADSALSQRGLSSELGVALGLANAYLKRCVRKGLVKVQHVPRRRYVYYLTPKGFSEKTRLTTEYLTSSLQFFRRARTELGELMATCERQDWRRVALAGASEVAEIATLTAHDHDVQLVGIISPGATETRMSGLPVVSSLGALGPVDAIIVTGLSEIEAAVAALGKEISEDRILVPKFVKTAKLKARRIKID